MPIPRSVTASAQSDKNQLDGLLNGMEAKRKSPPVKPTHWTLGAEPELAIVAVMSLQQQTAKPGQTISPGNEVTT